jgi:hypothetical protein
LLYATFKLNLSQSVRPIACTFSYSQLHSKFERTFSFAIRIRLWFGARYCIPRMAHASSRRTNSTIFPSAELDSGAFGSVV